MGGRGRGVTRELGSYPYPHFHPQVASLHELVMRSLGSRHWTTRRLAEMMDD